MWTEQAPCPLGLLRGVPRVCPPWSFCLYTNGLCLQDPPAEPNAGVQSNGNQGQRGPWLRCVALGVSLRQGHGPGFHAAVQKDPHGQDPLTSRGLLRAGSFILLTLSQPSDMLPIRGRGKWLREGKGFSQDPERGWSSGPGPPCFPLPVAGAGWRSGGVGLTWAGQTASQSLQAMQRSSPDG